MRAAVLYRVSDPRQVEGLSLDGQRRIANERCTREGWTLSLIHI